MGDLPAFAIMLPILVAAALAGLGALVPRRAVDAVAFVTMAATAGLCVWMASLAPGSPVPYWVAGYRIREGVPVGICLAVDPAAAWMAATGAALSAVILIFSSRYFESVRKHYTPLVLLLSAALVGFSLSGDLFNLFVFLELMAMCAYALTAHQIDEPDAIQGGLATAIANTLGGLLIVTGIAVLYAHTGTLNLAAAGEHIARAGTPDVAVVGFALVTAGLLTKGAIVPFHFWIGDAYAVAPAPVAALFAGVLTEVGLYGLARIRFALFGDGPGGAELLLVALGCATAVVGAAMALRQSHIKRMLAFTTVAHAGIVLVGIGAGTAHGTMGSAVYLLSHAFLNGGLLLVAGAILNRFGTVDLEDLRRRGRGMVLLPVTLAVAALGLSGVPPFGTFHGKAAIEEAAEHAGYEAVPWILAVASAMTAAAVARAALSIFTPLGGRDPGNVPPEDKPQEASAPEPSPARLLTPVGAVLVGASLVVGLVPGVLAEADRVARGLADGALYRDAVLLGRSHHVAAHAVGWPKPAAFVVAGVTLALAALLTAIPFGPRPVNRVRRALELALSPVERLHSGRLGDYIAWIIAGTAAVGWFLLVA